MDCVFCRIVAGEIPATIVARTGEALAFRDLNAQAPTHVLVIPTRHVASAAHLTAEERRSVLGEIMALATQVAADLGVASSGFRLVVNTGPDGGQSVDHLHVHLLGGRAMGWPPG